MPSTHWCFYGEQIVVRRENINSNPQGICEMSRDLLLGDRKQVTIEGLSVVLGESLWSIFWKRCLINLLSFPFCYNIVTKRFACTNHKLADHCLTRCGKKCSIQPHCALGKSNLLCAICFTCFFPWLYGASWWLFFHCADLHAVKRWLLTAYACKSLKCKESKRKECPNLLLKRNPSI